MTPVLLDDADFVVMESTYGDRQHPIPDHPSQRENTVARSAQLADIIETTFKRGGNVIIPSFAVGRDTGNCSTLSVTSSTTI